MGLLDTGFGMGMSFKVKRLNELREAQSEMGKTLKGMKDLQMQARMRGDSRAARDLGHVMGMTRGSIANVRGDIRSLEAEQAEAQARMNTRYAMGGRAAMMAGAAMTAGGYIGMRALRGMVGQSIRLDAALNNMAIRARMSTEAAKGMRGIFEKLSIELPGTTLDMVEAATIMAKMGTAQDQLADATRNVIILKSAEGSTTSETAKRLGGLYKAYKQNFPPTMKMGEAAGRLAASLIAVSDSVAGTAKELVEMTIRAAPTATQLGLTAHETFAFAGILTDLRIRTEMGGSALMKFFMTVKDKGKGIQAMASQLGVAFDKAWTLMTPVEKTQAFLKTLKAVSDAERAGALEAGSMTAALKKFGLGGLRASAAANALGTGLREAFADPETGERVTRFTELLDRSTSGFNNANFATERMKQKSKTLAFQMEVLSGTFENFTTALGDTFQPMLRVVTAVLTKVVNILTALSPETKKVIGWVLGLTTAFLLIVGPIVAFIGIISMMIPSIIAFAGSVASAGIVVTGLGSAFAVISGVVVLAALKIILVVGLLTAALYGLAAIGFFDPFIEGFKKVGKAIGVAWDVISGKKVEAKKATILEELGIKDFVFWIHDAVGWVKRFMRSFTSMFIEASTGKDVWMSLSDSVEFFWYMIRDALLPIWDTLNKAFGISKPILSETGDKAASFGEILGFVAAQIRWLIVGVAVFANVIIKFFTNIIATGIRLWGIIIRIINGIVGAIYTMGSLIKAVVTKDWDTIKNIVSGILLSLFDWIISKFSGVATFFAEAATWIVGVFDNIFGTGITAIVEKVISKVRGAINKVRSWLGLGVVEEKAAAAKSERERKAQAARDAAAAKKQALYAAQWGVAPYKLVGKSQAQRNKEKLLADIRAAREAEKIEREKLQRMEQARIEARKKAQSAQTIEAGVALSEIGVAVEEQRKKLLAAQGETKKALEAGGVRGTVAFAAKGVEAARGLGYDIPRVGGMVPMAPTPVADKRAGATTPMFTPIPDIEAGGAETPTPRPMVAPPPRGITAGDLAGEIRRGNDTLAQNTGQAVADAFNNRPIAVTSNITLNVDGNVLAQTIQRQTQRQASLRGTVPPVATSPAGR